LKKLKKGLKKGENRVFSGFFRSSKSLRDCIGILKKRPKRPKKVKIVLFYDAL